MFWGLWLHSLPSLGSLSHSWYCELPLLARRAWLLTMQCNTAAHPIDVVAGLRIYAPCRLRLHLRHILFRSFYPAYACTALEGPSSQIGYQ